MPMTMPTLYSRYHSQKRTDRFVYLFGNPYTNLKPNSTLNVSALYYYIYFSFSSLVFLFPSFFFFAFRSLLLFLCFRHFISSLLLFSFIVYIYFKCVIRRALWARSVLCSRLEVYWPAACFNH